MAKHLTYNDFDNVAAVRARFKDITLPMKWSEWRLVQPAQVGQIQGLPGSKGVAVATNGILVIIDTGATAFIGHLQSFVVEEGEEFVDPYGRKSTSSAVKKPKFKLFTEFSE
jgi:hypothetical protein